MELFVLALTRDNGAIKMFKIYMHHKFHSARKKTKKEKKKHLNQIKVLLSSDNEIIFVTSQRAVKRKEKWYKRDERDYETTTTPVTATATSAYYNNHSQNIYALS